MTARPPAWMLGRPNATAPQLSTTPRPGFGPAWMLKRNSKGNTVPMPAQPQPSTFPELPPLPVPDALSLPGLTPTIVSFPIDSQSPGLPQLQLPQPTVAPDFNALPTSLPSVVPVIRTQPEIQMLGGSWMSAVIGALKEVATDMVNSQFQAWANDPTDILTLAMSESAGSWTAQKDEGYSTKLGRNYFSMGLFQMNELYGPARKQRASDLIGKRLAAKVPSWPATSAWTKRQAETALLAIPDQIWAVMVLLREFSKFKNTYFETATPTMLAGQSKSTTLPSAIEREKARKIARQVNDLAAILHVPTTFILLKAFWLASSPDGVLNTTKALDPRVKVAAKFWPTRNDTLA
jgi:hypothetical protein